MGYQEVNRFDKKDPAEIVTVSFSFADEAGSISNPVVTIAHDSGDADPAPASMLVDGPQASGTTVMQKVQGGVLGATYCLRCEVEDDHGGKLVSAGLLPVRPA